MLLNNTFTRFGRLSYSCFNSFNFISILVLTFTILLYTSNISSAGTPLLISNLNAASGKSYDIVEDGLQNGSLVYIDRSYVYSAVPTWLEGATYINTANNDKKSSAASFISFDVNQDVIVYVAHDDRITMKPSWMTSFTDTGDDLIISGENHSIFAGNYLTGTITLGGNEGVSNSSMYTVIIVGQGTGSNSDTTAPTGSISINNGELTANLTSVILNLSAADDVGVTGYYISTSSFAPPASASGWITVTPANNYNADVPYTLSSGDGVKTVYVWYKDAADNISAVYSNLITLITGVTQLQISNLTVASGKAYEIVENGLQNGSLVYIDRSYVYSAVPILLEGTTYINTANNDKKSSAASFISFDVNQDVIVYVAHDDRITMKPSWMTSFTDTGDDLNISGENHSIFAGNYLTGTITLGGNEGVSNSSMYTVIIVGQRTGSNSDTTAPTGSISINNGELTASLTSVILNLSATDDVGIIGYYISTSSLVPSASASGWITVTPANNYNADVPYTLSSGDGVKTVYVWYKDAADNISAVYSNLITLITGVTPLQISNLTVASGKAYEIVENGLQKGALVYIDRSYVYSAVPTWLEGATYINTANNDKKSSAASFISFDVNQDVIVYVAHDDRITMKPSWMTSFADTGDDLIISGENHSIFAGNYLTGTITLGGNEGISNSSMYTVIIVGQGTGGDAPVLDLISDISVSEGETVGFSPTATDPDGDALTFSYTGWMTSDTYTTNYLDAGVYTVTVTVSDGKLTDSQVVTVTVTDTDITPPNSSVSINNGAVSTNSTSVTLSFSSTDNVGVTGYYLSTILSTPLASNPDWISVTPTINFNANVPYTLSSGDGVKTVYVWYKDEAGNVSNAYSDSINLITVSNVAPILDPIADITVNEGDTVTLNPTATDAGGDVLTFSYSGWMTSSSYTTNYNDAGTHTVTVTVSDGTLTDSQIVTITVKDPSQVTIHWDQNTESDLAGYKVYYGNSSMNYDSNVDVGNQTSYTLSGLVSGHTYYIAITSYDTTGNESTYSSEVIYNVPIF